MDKTIEEQLKMWIEQFICKTNTIQITNDNGNSFNESFKYLKEELYLKFKDLLIKNV